METGREVWECLQEVYVLFESFFFVTRNKNNLRDFLLHQEADMTFYPTNPTADKMNIGHHTPTLNPIALVALQGRMSRFAENPFGLVMTFKGEVSSVLIEWLFPIHFDSIIY